MGTFIWVLFCWFTCIISAFIELPPLLGSYPVGTRRLEVIDQARLDPYAPSPQPRTLTLQIWYPIEADEYLTPATWLPPHASAFFENELSLPPGILSLIKTHVSYNGTAIFPLTDEENETTPILVFSPGFGALTEQYTSILSSLASYGYTIIGVEHPYDSSPLERTDGSLVLRNDSAPLSFPLATVTRRADVLFLASQISQAMLCSWLPSSTPCGERGIGAKVRLGIFGHSSGGNTASWAMKDRSTLYEASVSLDGAFFPPLNETGFNGPVFYMAAETSCCGGLLKEQLEETWPFIQGWKTVVQINKTAHASFSDLVVLQKYLPNDPDDVLGDVGTIDGERMVKIVVEYVRAFWDWTLRGEKIDGILEKESKLFPEVVFKDLIGDGNGEFYLKKQEM